MTYVRIPAYCIRSCKTPNIGIHDCILEIKSLRASHTLPLLYSCQLSPPPSGVQCTRASIVKNTNFLVFFTIFIIFFSVNSGDYVEAVCERNVAENISKVLYPNDNVSSKNKNTAYFTVFL